MNHHHRSQRMGYFSIAFAALLVSFIGLAGLAPCQAADPPMRDRLVLKNGAVLEGEVTELNGKQRFYLLKTEDGTVIKFHRRQVRKVIRPTSIESEYLAKKAASEETVEAHWAMQAWCRENRLLKQREYHLLQVVNLDPDHKDARALLNFVDREGVWVHRDHFDQMQGYVKDNAGKFRLPEAIRMRANLEESRRSEKEWNKKVKNWLNKYKKKNDQEALKNLRAIRDGVAVEGLMKLVKEERDPRIQRMLLDIVGQIPYGSAQNALVVTAIASVNDENLAEQAVNLLKQPHYNRTSIVNTVIGRLKSKDNFAVNRAAWLIGQMEQKHAIRPLIEALVTTHTVRVAPDQGNMSASSGSDGVGMTQGNKVTKVESNFTNQAVLDALRLLTSADMSRLGFDEQAWLDWYIQENSVGSDRLNRDR